jgi:microsomal dipeptidase-like Zn-dependent dipeptidase
VLADLHVHYPMRVIEERDGTKPGTTVRLMGTARPRSRPGDKLRALVLRLATRLLSDKDLWSGYRVTVPYLREGGVGVGFSTLYSPFDEMDLEKPYASPPESAYFTRLLTDLQSVEDEVAGYDSSVIRVVHNRQELEECITDGATGLVHAVEGAFHLGDGVDEIKQNVATLAAKGVAYVTIAHLFFRQVATNANAIPFAPDPIYNLLFPQKANVGLTERGRAAIEALVANRVLVDISHMRPDAVQQTFKLLDEIDPQHEVPVISSHAGYRFGGQDYMHDEQALREIQRRDGVIGLIMAQHQLNDGIRKKETKSLPESLEVIYRHIDKIAEITSGHDHIALGTDFDGFIKPTMGGLQTSADLKDLERELRTKYPTEADAMTSGNVLRVLRKVWV